MEACAACPPPPHGLGRKPAGEAAWLHVQGQLPAACQDTAGQQGGQLRPRGVATGNVISYPAGGKIGGEGKEVDPDAPDPGKGSGAGGMLGKPIDPGGTALNISVSVTGPLVLYYYQPPGFTAVVGFHYHQRLYFSRIFLYYFFFFSFFFFLTVWDASFSANEFGG